MAEKFFVFDMDGTLSDPTHRRHFVRSKPTNWKAFNAGMVYDDVNVHVAEALRLFSITGKVFVFSARNERDRQKTEDWLKKHDLLQFVEEVWLRGDNDNRDDAVVKKEMAEAFKLRFGKLPDAVFDDRPKVVRMWRDLGVFVFNVYQSDEEF